MNLHSASEQKQNEHHHGGDIVVDMQQHEGGLGDDGGSLRESFENDQHAGVTPINRKQMRGASGPRYPQSRHYDAPQPYTNLQNRQHRQQLQHANS